MLKSFAKTLIAAVAGLSTTAAAALEVCDKPYWPYSEFTQAPAPFEGLLNQWPDLDRARGLVQAHHERARLDFRGPAGPCRPRALPRMMDAMFGGIFSASDEERYRAVNGFYASFMRSCRIVNWNNIEGSAAAALGRSPHVVRYGNTSDALCGPSAIFLTLNSGLVGFSMEGGSCDVENFTATKVKSVSLNSVFDGVHSEESIVERLVDYIGPGEPLTLAPYGRPTPEHAKLGIKPLRTGFPMYPSLFRDAVQIKPYGRHINDRYFLIYPTINNPRGENNRFFPTFTSSLRIDIVEVTEAQADRRFLRDSCRRNQDNTDQPILNFR